MLPMHGEILARQEVKASFPAYRASKIDKIIFTSMCPNVDSDVPFIHIFMPEVGGNFYTGMLVNKHFCDACVPPAKQ